MMGLHTAYCLGFLSNTQTTAATFIPNKTSLYYYISAMPYISTHLTEISDVKKLNNKGILLCYMMSNLHNLRRFQVKNKITVMDNLLRRETY